MPVWHEATRALRESGDLTVIGITQEQHPERCGLFAQWKGIDWPILWDPFNLTEARAVGKPRSSWGSSESGNRRPSTRRSLPSKS